MANECSMCGLAACDLPDGVDSKLIFEGGLCQGCQQIPERPYEYVLSEDELHD